MQKKQNILILDIKGSLNNFFVSVISLSGDVVGKYSFGIITKKGFVKKTKFNFLVFVMGTQVGQTFKNYKIIVRVHGILLFRILPFLKGFFKTNTKTLFLEIKNKQVFNGCRPRKLKRLLLVEVAQSVRAHVCQT